MSAVTFCLILNTSKLYTKLFTGKAFVMDLFVGQTGGWIPTIIFHSVIRATKLVLKNGILTRDKEFIS